MITGDLTGVLPEVKNELQRLLILLNKQIIVTSGYRQGDPAQHGQGLAVDIVVPAYAGRLLDLYLAAERCNWTGIGVYPTWHHTKGGPEYGGLHLDMRTGPPARWMGLGSGKGQQYVALNLEQLKKAGVI